MNATQIRILAIVTMTIDHIGFILLPQYFFLRIVGRLSFPLFAWLIANGVVYTKNERRYLMRIGGMALVSQAPYLLTFRLVDPSFSGWNVFLTLFLGLATILIIKKWQNPVIRYCAVLTTSILAIVFNSSYGAAGVLAVVICYIFRKNIALMVSAQMIMLGFFYIVPEGYLAYNAGRSIFSITPLYLYQPLGAVALLITMFYNREKGWNIKYFFYFYYPLHLLALYALSHLFF